MTDEGLCLEPLKLRLLFANPLLLTSVHWGFYHGVKLGLDESKLKQDHSG